MTDTDLKYAPETDASSGAPGSDAAHAPRPASGRARRGGGLQSMVLTELRQLAGELGIKGTSGMRKGDLVAAIADRQSSTASVESRERRPDTAGPANGTAPVAGETGPVDRSTARSSPTQNGTAAAGQVVTGAQTTTGTQDAADARADTSAQEGADSSAGNVPVSADATAGGNGARGERSGTRKSDGQNPDGATNGDRGRGGDRHRDNSSRQGREGGRNQQRGSDQRNESNPNRTENNRTDAAGGNNRTDAAGGNNRTDNARDDDSGEGGRGRRGRRFRERRRGRDGSGGGGEPQVSEDDVLQPVAGILDVLDNYAFVRTSGYLAGSNDVYVSMNLVRKNGLRRGDAITGAVKLPREGEQPNQRQKFNPLVRLDTVNGGDVDTARRRPDFQKLTPLYPNERLRLETSPEKLTTRIIDLIMPIGKGQRALISAPPKAGKTTIMQDIANAITINNPECYLMVVLVDERPEEVTDMQRSVKGEVIASTFDRPPSDHTSVAELAIERAKRLVEQGKDVVVLLDSITRLGRAYNNASPASGRILSGGIDSTALYPPKRFLGAARNIENGGSLTIIATAMVETGSTGDTVIFEEFKGTGNAELKLDRKISERRVFPAVDVHPSSTRKDELLLSPEEFTVVHKLRRLLSGLDSQAAIDLLMSQLRKTKTNYEFLMQVQKNAPGTTGDD